MQEKKEAAKKVVSQGEGMGYEPEVLPDLSKLLSLEGDFIEEIAPLLREGIVISPEIDKKISKMLIGGTSLDEIIETLRGEGLEVEDIPRSSSSWWNGDNDEEVKKG